MTARRTRLQRFRRVRRAYSIRTTPNVSLRIYSLRQRRILSLTTSSAISAALMRGRILSLRITTKLQTISIPDCFRSRRTVIRIRSRILTIRMTDRRKLLIRAAARLKHISGITIPTAEFHVIRRTAVQTRRSIIPTTSRADLRRPCARTAASIFSRHTTARI